MDISQLLQQVNEAYQKGDYAKAFSLCDQVVRQDARVHPALYLRGVILMQKGSAEAAAESLCAAVNLAPAVPQYQVAYGTSLLNMQKFPQAIDAFQRAIKDSPRMAAAHRGLGRALTQMWELELAMQSLNKAIELGAPRAETLADISIAQRRLGKRAEAAQSARDAIELQPSFAWAYNVLGLVQGDQGEYRAAMGNFEKAIALRPDLAEPHNNLAKIYRDIGEFQKAVEILRDLTNRFPRYIHGHANFGMALVDVGEVEQAIAAYRRALELRADACTAHSNLLLCLNFNPGISRRQVLEEHRRWGMTHGIREQLAAPPRRQISSTEPLRVGYISADLWRHPVAFFLEPLLKNHDPNVVTAFVYSDVQRPDEVTERIRTIPPRWTDIAGRSLAVVDRVIRSDEIDILVDLGGHTENNRLLLFTRRMAPVQVSYLGYPNTTGLLTMDYRLTDPWADPSGSDAWYTEKLVRLPRCFLCYAPPADAPAVERVPQQTITFGSFNRLAKLTDSVIALWAQILAAVPDSRLVLKDSATGDPAVCEAVRMRLNRAGIDPQRVTLEPPRRRQADHLNLYNSIDIALDTSPYNGTTTTCEALWMGVPVVTLAGEVHASRVSLSILHAIGHDELIATTSDAYVQIAVNLARDNQRRQQLHENLRQAVAESALMDGPGLARAVESAYQQMVQAYRTTAS